MTPVAYVALIQEEGPREFIVTFPDVPEAIAQGSDLVEARLNAHDALSAALEAYVELGRPFPARDELEVGRLKKGIVRFDVAVEPKLAARAGGVASWRLNRQPMTASRPHARDRTPARRRWASVRTGR